MIRSAAVALYFLLVVLLLTPFILLSVLAGWRAPLYSAGVAAARLARRILGVEIEASGLDRLDPRTPYVFMPNHQSFLDGPLVMILIPGAPRVILKRSVLSVPIAGLAMRHVGFVAVDRKGAEGGKRSIARAAALMRERGYSFLIFPEGTRSRDGKLRSFRRGGFFLALASGSPIVPVTIRGTFELMPKGQWFARRGKVGIAFHGPVPVEGCPAEDMPLLMDRVREAILSGYGPAAAPPAGDRKAVRPGAGDENERQG